MSVKAINKAHFDYSKDAQDHQNWVRKKRKLIDGVRDAGRLTEKQWDMRRLMCEPFHAIPYIDYRRSYLPVIGEATIINIAVKQVKEWDQRLFDIFFYCVRREKRSGNKQTLSGIISYSEIAFQAKEELLSPRSMSCQTSPQAKAFCKENRDRLVKGIEVLDCKYKDFFKRFHDSLFLLHKSTAELVLTWNDKMEDEKFCESVRRLGARVKEKAEEIDSILDDREEGLRADYVAFRDLKEVLSETFLREYFAQKKSRLTKVVEAPNPFGEEPLKLDKDSESYFHDCAAVERLYTFLPAFCSKSMAYVKSFIFEAKKAVEHLRDLNTEL